MQHDSDICRSCAVAQTIKELIPAGRGFPEEEGEGETIGSQESERSVEDEEASESSSLGDFIVQDSDVSSEESEEDEEADGEEEDRDCCHDEYKVMVNEKGVAILEGLDLIIPAGFYVLRKRTAVKRRREEEHASSSQDE